VRLIEFARLLRSLMGGHWWLATFVLFVLLVASLAEGIGFSLVIPLVEVVSSTSGARSNFGALGGFLHAIVDRFPEPYRLAGVLALLVTVFLVKSLTLVLATGLIRYFVNTLRLEWASAAFRAHLEAPYARVVEMPQGVVAQNIAGEPDMAAKGVLVLVEGLARLIQICALFTVLCLVNWKLTLAITLVAAAVLAATWGRSGRFSVGSGRFRKRIRQEVAELVTESVLALRTVKLLDLIEERRKHLEERLAAFRANDTRFEVLTSLPGHLTEFAAVAAGAGAILIMTLGLGMPIETVLPLVALFGLVFVRLAGAVSYLFSKRMQFFASVPSLKTVRSIMTTQAEQDEGGRTLSRISGAIRFEDIHLTPPGRAPLFAGLNLVAPPVGLTAIVGPSGVGKTTLVDLLVRLREPDRGRITIDGVDVREYDVRSIRARVGYVTQDPQLFNGTVRENLLLGRPDATPSEIEHALVKAQALEFVRAMPTGLDTALGRGAVTLSGGQRQRLALARELLRDPDLFIFDEPTSALDRDAEAVVRDLMTALAKTRPVLVIAHRLDTIRDAALIYRLGEGRAVPARLEDLYGLPAAANA
jgi:ATP-binding cassette, subfamily B, bacterial MsbA